MKIGFIGTGNMAKAIIQGIIAKKQIVKNDIYCFDVQEAALKQFAKKTGIQACKSNTTVVENADLIVLAVKPQQMPNALRELSPILKEKKPLLVSIAAGLTLVKLAELAGDADLAIIRVMPNINAMCKAGVAAICANSKATQAQVDTVAAIFETIGQTFNIAEKDFATFSGIAGCSPAFTFLYIDALSRAGVKNGLPKAQATQIAAQAVLGSAKMLLESNKHPWELIDLVCSPGGTTVTGIVALEEEAFLATIVKAVDATIKRDNEIGK